MKYVDEELNDMEKSKDKIHDLVLKNTQRLPKGKVKDVCPRAAVD